MRSSLGNYHKWIPKIHTGVYKKKTKKYKQMLSACQKADGNSFLGHDRKGVLMAQFIQQRTTITSEMYCDTLKKWRRAIQNKRH
jgi:hypothetical protein